jgi:hypothetical protein
MYDYFHPGQDYIFIPIVRVGLRNRFHLAEIFSTIVGEVQTNTL